MNAPTALQAPAEREHPGASVRPAQPANVAATAAPSSPPANLTVTLEQAAPAAGRGDGKEIERAGEKTARLSRRDRDVAEFLARREQVLAMARAEAGDRIRRQGEQTAVTDALAAMAHSGAAPWPAHRERLDDEPGGVSSSRVIGLTRPLASQTTVRAILGLGDGEPQVPD